MSQPFVPSWLKVHITWSQNWHLFLIVSSCNRLSTRLKVIICGYANGEFFYQLSQEFACYKLLLLCVCSKVNTPHFQIAMTLNSRQLLQQPEAHGHILNSLNVKLTTFDMWHIIVGSCSRDIKFHCYYWLQGRRQWKLCIRSCATKSRHKHLYRICRHAENLANKGLSSCRFFYSREPCSWFKRACSQGHGSEFSKFFEFLLQSINIIRITW